MNENFFDFSNSGGIGSPGSSPADSFSTDMSSGIGDLFSQNAINSSSAGATNYSDPGLTDMFSAQEDFKSAGFNPNNAEVNFENFASKETFGSALSKGLDSFAYKFGNTFVDYWKDYGRMADALVHMDWGKMMPDKETMLQQYYRDQMDMQKNQVFVAPEDEDGIFNKKFLSEFVGNAGFALGTFAGLAVELTADTLIAGLSGGSGSGIFAATFARLAAKSAAKSGAKQVAKKGGSYIMDDVLKGLTRAGSSVDDIASVGKEATKKINDATTIASRTKTATENVVGNTFKIFTDVFDITKAKSVSDLGKRIVNATPVLGTGVEFAQKVAAGSKAGLKGGELFGMGLQGVRRMAQELNMSSTEASFEAVSSYGDTLEALISDFKTQNGRPPQEMEMTEMEDVAMKAASGNYNSNLAILMATNKLQFGNMFSKYMPSNRYMRDVLEASDPGLLTVGSKTMTQVYKKGQFGTLNVLGKVAKDFGKKEATYQFMKSVGKNFAKFELAEGIQENLQETTATGWKNYYVGKQAMTGITLGEAFEMGLEEQFTKQGFKTFLMGAMTGMIVSGPTRAVNIGIESLQKKVSDSQVQEGEKNPRVEAEKEFQKNLDTLNGQLREIATGKFKDKNFNFAAQVNAAVAQTDAASKNLEYEFQNSKDDAFIAAVTSAKKTGSVKALVQAVRNMGENMSEDEFKASFGMDLKDTKYNSASEFAESIAGKIETFSKTIDDIRATVGKLIDPRVYEDGSRGQYVATLLRQTQEDAVEIIAMNQLKGNMSAERAKQVANDIRNIQSMSSSSDFALRTLSEGRFIEGELGNISSEMRSLEKNLKEVSDPTIKKDIKERIKILSEKEKLMTEWLNFFEGSEVVNTDEDGNKSSQGFTYGRFVGEMSKDEILTKEVDKETGEEREVKKIQQSFNPKSKKARRVFRKLVNVLNKEAGNDTQIGNKDMVEAFDKYSDYLQLDQDVRDYMSAVESLSDPDNLIKTYERMVDGNFKFRVEMGLHMLDNTRQVAIEKIIKSGHIKTNEQFVSLLKDIQEIYTNIPEYKEVIELLSDVKSGYSDVNKGFKLINTVGEKFNKLMVGIYAKYEVRDYKKAPTDSEYGDFTKNGRVADERINAMANAVFADPDKELKEILHERELEMYEAKKAEVDAIVTNLKNGPKPAAPTAEIKKTENGNPVEPEQKPEGPQSDFKKMAHELGIEFSLPGGRKAFWHRKSKKFVLFNKNGVEITNHRQLVKYTQELFSKPGMAKLFWNDLMDSEQRDHLFDRLVSLGELSEKAKVHPDEMGARMEYLIMTVLKGRKFNKSLARDMSDIRESAWIAKRGGTNIDTFALEVVGVLLASEGFGSDGEGYSNMSSDRLIEEVKSVIRMYPDGITLAKLEAARGESSLAYQVEQAEAAIINETGSDPVALMELLIDYLADPKSYYDEKRSNQDPGSQDPPQRQSPPAANQQVVPTVPGQNPTPSPGVGFDKTKFATDLFARILPVNQMPTSATLVEFLRKSAEVFMEHQALNPTRPMTQEQFFTGVGKSEVEGIAASMLLAEKVKSKTPEVKVATGNKTPTVISEIPGNMVLTISELESFQQELVEFDRQVLQNPANLSKFVEEGSSSESKALDFLVDLLTCGK